MTQVEYYKAAFSDMRKRIAELEAAQANEE